MLFIGSTSAVVSVDEPVNADARFWIFQGMMQLGKAAPGVYTISGECGFLSVTFALPPPDITCPGTGPSCTRGCSSLCSASFGCLPCAPEAPVVGYGASGISDCLDDGSAPTFGSWTVTLTDVQPFVDDAGTDPNGPYFVVHGAVTGTLLAGDASDMATIDIAF